MTKGAKDSFQFNAETYGALMNLADRLLQEYPEEYVTLTDDNWLMDWLIKSLAALNNARPIDLIKTNDGMKLIVQTIGRIIYGVYA